MAKTTKRIAAIVLAVMMLIAMVPTAVSAATQGTFTVQCSKPGYTFEVFQVATLNETTGEYVATATNAGVVNALKADLSSTQDLLAACDTAKTSDLGSSQGSWLTTGADKSFTVDYGIYYVKCTGTPVADAEVTRNSIVVVPGTETFSVATKVKDGSTPDVYKTFGDGTSATKTFSTNDVIAYTLKADITGTASNKLEKFIIKDMMDASLDASKVNITSVKAVKKDGSDVDLTYDKIAYTGATFAVSIKAVELNNDTFYDYDQVVVNFTTQLAADAVTATLINNTDSLVYKFANQSDVEVEGQTVSLKTYDVSVKKVDSTDTTKTLANATFAIYSDEACTNELATATSGADGIAKFAYKFAEGTYYVKETQAPNGYNLNTSVFEVKVDGTAATTTITVQDTPTAIPNTGGVGTMMFTIGGASLIALAGVLFVVVMKKRKAVK